MTLFRVKTMKYFRVKTGLIAEEFYIIFNEI